MSDYSTQQIRNVALIGPGGVGKTTLADAMLHRAGVVSRRGSVDDGTSALDRDPEAIDRKSSVVLSLASFDWKAPDGGTYRINLLDTPGHPDFEADVAAALSVADLAVIVVSASDGIGVGVESAWRRCNDLGLPRFVFVTREDRPRADFERLLAELSDAFGSGFTPLELPLGEEESFHGVADVISEEALEYEPDGSHHVAEMPASVATHEHEVHERVIEEIVTGDDEQLERYLEGDELSRADLERTLAAEVAACTEFPVLVGSGTTAIGVDRLADYICEVGPSPASRPRAVVAGDRTVEIEPDPRADPLLAVFSTRSDQYVGRVSLFRVLTGTLRPDTELVESISGATERVHSLLTVCGDATNAVSRFVAGDIGATTKLANARTGSTLHPAGLPVSVPPLRLPTPHLAAALIPRSQTDEDRLSDALHRLAHDDPSLVFEYDELARHTVVRYVGDTQLTVMLARLEHRYDVHVDTAEVRVPYRRTITKPSEAQGRVKKQSGGHGQFAIVDLRVSPLPRGAGTEFADTTVGGAIPKQYVQAAEQGALEALQSGGALGIPIIDVRVECYDGKTHSVDSSDMAFRTAAAQGALAAVDAAAPVMLEPVAQIEVSVPVEAQGDVLGDLGGRRGRIVNSVAADGEQRIEAVVPLAELSRYAMDLRSLTSGRGTFVIGDVEYAELPEHLVRVVVDELGDDG